MEKSLESVRYTKVASLLHWLIALLVLLNIAAAWLAEGLSKPDQALIMGNHEAIGILVIGFTLLRIVWRLLHQPPAKVETLKTWEIATSRVVHALLYLLMLVLPLSGWAMSSAYSHGKPVSLFGLAEIPGLPVADDRATVGLFHEMHVIFGWAMVVLAALHIAAALKHQLIDKDGTLRRMVLWMD